jgi:hypothetical protein
MFKLSRIDRVCVGQGGQVREFIKKHFISLTTLTASKTKRVKVFLDLDPAEAVAPRAIPGI